MISISENELGKIRWRCRRRGMLELDEMLGDFFDQNFKNLSASEQRLFIKLLDQPDPVLFDWLLGHADPEDSDVLVLVKKIRDL